MKTIYIETLGCEKNTVDSETMIGLLEKAGHTFTVNPADADVIIVNTCAFIGDAKKEAVDRIFSFTAFREHGKCKRLIATGCMPQRYNEDIRVAFREVDAFIGTNNLDNIIKAVNEGATAITPAPAKYEEHPGSRVHTGAKGSAFIRIADGCFSTCSFCAIPLIRGAYRSRTIENIMNEARGFAAIGVQEINLIAQETTYYGQDLYGERMLPKLLKGLAGIDGIRWIRVLYQNPSLIDENVLNAFYSHEKILPYFDIPFQHVNSGILRNMRRWGGHDEFLALIEQIRTRDPESIVRTSFITGFPGETKAEFNELMDFVHEAEFDRMGIFVYSEEEGTDALKLELPKADEAEAMHRREELMHAQLAISEKRLSRLIGTTQDVLVESVSEKDITGRSWHNAPEVDGFVIAPGTNARPGDFLRVKIDHANEHDIYGTIA